MSEQLTYWKHKETGEILREIKTGYMCQWFNVTKGKEERVYMNSVWEYEPLPTPQVGEKWSDGDHYIVICQEFLDSCAKGNKTLDLLMLNYRKVEDAPEDAFRVNEWNEAVPRSAGLQRGETVTHMTKEEWEKHLQETAPKEEEATKPLKGETWRSKNKERQGKVYDILPDGGGKVNIMFLNPYGHLTLPMAKFLKDWEKVETPPVFNAVRVDMNILGEPSFYTKEFVEQLDNDIKRIDAHIEEIDGEIASWQNEAVPRSAGLQRGEEVRRRKGTEIMSEQPTEYWRKKSDGAVYSVVKWSDGIDFRYADLHTLSRSLDSSFRIMKHEFEDYEVLDLPKVGEIWLYMGRVPEENGKLRLEVMDVDDKSIKLRHEDRHTNPQYKESTWSYTLLHFLSCYEKVKEAVDAFAEEEEDKPVAPRSFTDKLQAEINRLSVDISEIDDEMGRLAKTRIDLQDKRKDFQDMLDHYDEFSEKYTDTLL